MPRLDATHPIPGFYAFVDEATYAFEDVTLGSWVQHFMEARGAAVCVQSLARMAQERSRFRRKLAEAQVGAEAHRRGAAIRAAGTRTTIMRARGRADGHCRTMAVSEDGQRESAERARSRGGGSDRSLVCRPGSAGSAASPFAAGASWGSSSSS